MVLLNQTTYQNKIWYGRKTEPCFNANNSIGSVLYEALKNNDEHISQICYPSNKKYINKEILTLSVRIAQHLEIFEMKLKLQQDAVIGICAGNSDFLAPLVFGCMFRGLIISTSDPNFDKDVFKHIYSITKPKLMFCDGSVYQKIKNAFAECGLKSTKIFTIRDHIEGVPSLDLLLKEIGKENEFRCVDLDEGYEQTAVIICSSGTTGLPKCVCQSHASILNMLKLPPSSNILSFDSIYCISGILTLIAGTIDNITRIISYCPYNPQDAMEIIKLYNIEMLMVTPNQLALMMASTKFDKTHMESLKLFYMIGSYLSFKLVNTLKNHLPQATIYNSYVISEICGAISCGAPINNGNCGQLFDNIELKIIDEHGRQQIQYVVGEICIRTPHKWSGYYNNPQATAEIYDSEQWFHTGDMGYVDDQGCICIVDRKKDILNYNNFQFYPTKTEEVIHELSDIVEVCVCGIPDVLCNYLPAAAIVKSANSTLTEEQVYNKVTVLAHYKHLRGGVYFVDQLPKTMSGKVVRRKVAELCTDLYIKRKQDSKDDK